MANKKRSIEETVEQWAKEQLKDIKLYPKTDFINPQIEKALKNYPLYTFSILHNPSMTDSRPHEVPSSTHGSSNEKDLTLHP